MGYLLFTQTNLFLLPAPYPMHFKEKKSESFQVLFLTLSRFGGCSPPHLVFFLNNLKTADIKTLKTKTSLLFQLQSCEQNLPKKLMPRPDSQTEGRCFSKMRSG